MGSLRIATYSSHTKTCWQSPLYDVVWIVLHKHMTNISDVSHLVNTQFYLQESSQNGGILAPNGQCFASNIGDT